MLIFTTLGFYLNQCVQIFDTNFFLCQKSLRIFNSDSFAKHPGTGNDTFQEIRR